MKKHHFNNAALARRGITFHWRAQSAMALGVMVATACLTGALVVGDSLRGSLRELALERLGRTEVAVQADHYFRENLAADLIPLFPHCAPVILLNGSAEKVSEGFSAQVGNAPFAPGVQVIGADGRFWELFNLTAPELASDGVVLNAALAESLSVQVPDTILLRVPRPSSIPREFALGERDDTIVTIRTTVSAIVPDCGIGGFRLQPAQATPRNIFVPLKYMQKLLGTGEKANTILAALGEMGAPIVLYRTTRWGIAFPWIRLDSRLDYAFDAMPGLLGETITLEDCDLHLRPNDSRGYLSFESGRLSLRQPELNAAQGVASDLNIAYQANFTYLANSMSLHDRTVPYSTIGTLASGDLEHFGPYNLIDGTPAVLPKADETLINQWTAGELEASVGDTITMEYYISGPRGELATDTVSLRVSGILAMTGAAADPGLPPVYPGLSDAETMSEWKAPFPINLARIRPQDEAYWDTWRATPKAFIQFERAQQLWSSRFGVATALRLRPADGELKAAATQFAGKYTRSIPIADTGIIVNPVRKQALAASAGATDFGGLFIGFSMFLIASALLLVSLFFRLGLERRASEIGVLAATGWPVRHIRRVFVREGLLIALFGALPGLLLALAYASIMLYGLSHWWNEAVGTSRLAVHPRAASLLIGLAVTLALTWLTLRLTIRALLKAPVRLLLSGRTSERYALSAPSRIWPIDTIVVFLAGIAAIALFAFSWRLEGPSQAGAFFGCGALLLVAGLSGTNLLLRTRGGGARPLMSKSRLALRGAAANRARSILCIALVACAVFVVVTVAASRREAGAEPGGRHSGSGGFALLGETDSPLLYDLNTTSGREHLLERDPPPGLFDGVTIYSARLNPGDDISCLNLYQPQHPRVVGVGADFVARGGFAFAGSQVGEATPWKVLEQSSLGGAPAIADANAAQWILKARVGDTIPIGLQEQNLQTAVLTRLLVGSMLQSELLISESAFQTAFPDRPGYSFFFIDCPPEKTTEVGRFLESALRDFGMRTTTPAERLSQYLAVENTYMSTFQAIGGLGLLLGTLGLGVVLYRNAIERRSELALLLAVGYQRTDLAALIVLETALLLAAGVAIGTIAALFAAAQRLLEHPGSIPWGSLGALLAAVMALGLLSAVVSAWRASRMALLPALRGE